MNAVLIQSLPYGHPGRLVYLFTPSSILKFPAEALRPSAADFFDLRKECKSFVAMTQFSQATYNLAGKDRVERVGAAKVDAEFFSTLEVAPELGRSFDQMMKSLGMSGLP